MLLLIELLSCSIIPPIDTLPIITTVYWPPLGDTNCQEPCNRYADGSLVDLDASVAACPIEWRGAILVIDGLGSFKCRDTGGAIGVSYDEYWQQWVIRIDIQYVPEDFEYNYWLWINWHLVW